MLYSSYFFLYFHNYDSFVIPHNIFFCVFTQPILPEPSPSIFTPVPGVREIVLIVSPPACGKTKLSKKFDPILYSRINQDTLKTIDKCLIKAKEELNLGKNVVVDNTNISNETRAKWISLAKSENIKVRIRSYFFCYVFFCCKIFFSWRKLIFPCVAFTINIYCALQKSTTQILIHISIFTHLLFYFHSLSFINTTTLHCHFHRYVVLY